MLSFTLVKQRQFWKEKCPRKGYWWHVANEPLPTSTSRDKGGAHSTPTSQIPSMLTSRHLPLPIRQVAFDSKGKPTAIWVPSSQAMSLTQLTNPPTSTSSITCCPRSNRKKSAPSGSPLNLSANTRTTGDASQEGSARDKGKGKARETHEDDGGSHRQWRDY